MKLFTNRNSYVLLRNMKHRFSYVHINYSISLFIFFFTLLIPTYAEELKTHYIIAFDQAIPLYREQYLSPSLIETIDKVLEENKWNPGEDYISVVGYALENNPSMDRFVRPYKDVKGNDILWKKYKYGLSGNMNNWPYGQPLLNLNDGPQSSMQSLAKPYIIIEANQKDDSTKVVGKTILLLVTDEKVNGTDDNYQQEWYRVKGISGANIGNYSKIESDVFSTMRKFNEEFKFEQLKIKHEGNAVENIALSPDRAYKIVSYEVVPVEKPSIHAVTDLPSPLPIQRVRGGFKVKTDAASITPKYKVKDIILRGRNGEILGKSESGSFDFVIPSKKISAGDTIGIEMSLLLKDGFYDGVVISPNNERYKAGMSNRQVVKLQDEAKILGIFPLKDTFWWWFPNDIFTAVMIWDFIILLIGIIVIGWILYICFIRINRYKPSNDKLKIKKL